MWTADIESRPGERERTVTANIEQRLGVRERERKLWTVNIEKEQEREREREDCGRTT